MHDSEKSDSAIVAVKPPNKAGLPVAEAVERRAGAKGNADQQNTHRTQSRIRVTQALSRVRQAAGTCLARSAFRRQTPKVGAGCPNGARPDPRGGCPAMGIPTAIPHPPRPIISAAKKVGCAGITRRHTACTECGYASRMALEPSTKRITCTTTDL